MKNLATHLPDPRKTTQTQPIPGREGQMHANPAGGFVFAAGDWERLDRFLIIGTEGGTYYASEAALTVENAAVVRRCLAADMPRTLRRIVEVSDGGLAPKNDPAILALALAFTVENVGHVPQRVSALQSVCRTGTHLFQFLEAVRDLRGGGRGLNGAVRRWLMAKPADSLAYQMAKYRNRAGWTWRDVLRRYRPNPAKPDDRSALYAWAVGKPLADKPLPGVVAAMEAASTLEGPALAAHIREHKLPWECVPDTQTTDPAVLEALFESMPYMATVRQLSKLQAHGVLPKRRDDCLARLRDEQAIAKSRIHPVALMLAAHAYEAGSGRHLTWTPDAAIVDALDDAFQIALKVAPPTGKSILIGLDVSGSMSQNTASGVPLHKVSAAMALTYVRTDHAHVCLFHTAAGPLPLSGRMRVTDATRMLDKIRGGGTDCSLPFSYALHHKMDVDAFVVMTDNETWAGSKHPAQALKAYRRGMNKPAAKVVWCAMTAGKSSLGLPDDQRALGVAGFDASAPQIVGNFIAS